MLAELASNPVFTRERPKLEGWVKGVIEEWEEERDKEEAKWEESTKQEVLEIGEKSMQKVDDNGKNEDNMQISEPADEKEDKQCRKEVLGVVIEEAEVEVSSTELLETEAEQESGEGLVVEPGWRTRGRQASVSRGSGMVAELQLRKMGVV